MNIIALWLPFIPVMGLSLVTFFVLSHYWSDYRNGFRSMYRNGEKFYHYDTLSGTVNGERAELWFCLKDVERGDKGLVFKGYRKYGDVFENIKNKYVIVKSNHNYEPLLKLMKKHNPAGLI